MKHSQLAIARGASTDFRRGLSLIDQISRGSKPGNIMNV